jgi:hypothetical protein
MPLAGSPFRSERDSMKRASACDPERLACRPSARLAYQAARRAGALLLLALLSTACARPIVIGSESRAVFSVMVHNDLQEAMIVSYTDPRGEALLGSVPAGGSQRFEIANPPSADISITARNAAGSRRAGPFPVTLIAGTVQAVHIR